jgi:hypothetical protein
MIDFPAKFQLTINKNVSFAKNVSSLPVNVDNANVSRKIFVNPVLNNKIGAKNTSINFTNAKDLKHKFRTEFQM